MHELLIMYKITKEGKNLRAQTGSVGLSDITRVPQNYILPGVCSQAYINNISGCLPTCIRAIPTKQLVVKFNVWNF